jgi:tetratricopeptide (TPR) repeat protein
MNGRVIVEAFAEVPAVSNVPSWETEPGESGLHPQDLRQDPYEAVDALKQLVDLGYMPSSTDSQTQQLGSARLESRCNLGVVYMTTHRHGLAVPIFRELVATKPTEHRFVLPLAQCQQALGDWKGCIETLSAYLDLGTDFVDARILLAHALACAGQGQAADLEIDRLVAEDGARPEMAFPLGQLMASRQRWAEAEKFLARARSLKPQDANVCVARARLALQQGQHDQAVEHCLDATEIAMALPEAHFLLGVAFAWMGELEHAIQSLQNAAAMQPGHIEAQRFLAAVAEAAHVTPIRDHALAAVAALEARADAGGAFQRMPDAFGAAAWLARNSTVL